MTEKQFPPSIQKLRKARKKGNIVKTQVVTLCATWWGIVVLISTCLPWVRSGTLLQWARCDSWKPVDALYAAGLLVVKIVLVCSGTLSLIGIGVTLLQTNWFMSVGQLAKGVEQLKPGAYWGKLKQNAIGVLAGNGRVLALSVGLIPVLLGLIDVTPSAFDVNQIEIILQNFRTVALRTGYVLTVLGIVAYGLTRWRFMRQNRMSLQELKDEFKESEGDPHFKSAQKQEHRAMLFSEIRKRVQRAKVVVVYKMKD